eukprot:c19967_g1_i3.p1 GENE.c19967_g1_i3~~c19967_g1_i3.p1  ORF type:complete len:675 (-),score=86.83 c19967_g1_i3:76-1809(-)
MMGPDRMGVRPSRLKPHFYSDEQSPDSSDSISVQGPPVIRGHKSLSYGHEVGERLPGVQEVLHNPPILWEQTALDEMSARRLQNMASAEFNEKQQERVESHERESLMHALGRNHKTRPHEQHSNGLSPSQMRRISQKLRERLQTYVEPSSDQHLYAFHSSSHPDNTPLDCLPPAPILPRKPSPSDGLLLPAISKLTRVTSSDALKLDNDFHPPPPKHRHNSPSRDQSHGSGSGDSSHKSHDHSMASTSSRSSPPLRPSATPSSAPPPDPDEGTMLALLGAMDRLEPTAQPQPNIHKTAKPNIHSLRHSMSPRQSLSSSSSSNMYQQPSSSMFEKKQASSSSNSNSHFNQQTSSTDHSNGTKVDETSQETQSNTATNPTNSVSSDMTTHLRAHSHARPYVCDYNDCSKAFAQSGGLVRHRRTHTGDKPYHCQFPGCDRSFTESGHLTRHNRSHTGEKPYMCPFDCDKAFSTSYHLVRHQRTHTGDRPYKCDHPGCGKAFSQSGGLQRHQRVHQRGQKTQRDVVDQDDDQSTDRRVGSSATNSESQSVSHHFTRHRKETADERFGRELEHNLQESLGNL